MYTYALGGDAAQQPDAAPPEQTSTAGAAAGVFGSAVKDIYSGLMDVSATGLFGQKRAQEEQALFNQPGPDMGPPLTWHGWQPSKILTKEDYLQDYATPSGFHDGMTEGEATVLHDKYTHDQYLSAAEQQHPWVSFGANTASQLTNPLWYIPVVDWLKYGMVATKILSAERAGKALFDFGEFGERLAQGNINVGALTTAQEGAEDLGGKEPDVRNPLLSMFVGGATGFIGHAIGLPLRMRAAAMAKAADDLAMNRPTDVTEHIPLPQDYTQELTKEINSPTPDANVLRALAGQKADPLTVSVARALANTLEGKASTEDTELLAAAKAGKTDEYLDTQIAKAKEVQPEELPEGKIRLWNSGEGRQEMWTADEGRARDHSISGTHAVSRVFNKADVENLQTKPGSPAQAAAQRADNAPSPSDYFFGDHPSLLGPEAEATPELREALRQLEEQTPAVRALEDIKKQSHLTQPDNSPLGQEGSPVDLEGRPPYNADGTAMNADQIVDERGRIWHEEEIALQAAMAKSREIEARLGELEDKATARHAKAAQEDAEGVGPKTASAPPGEAIASEALPDTAETQLPPTIEATMREGEQEAASLRTKGMALLRALTCRMS